jgi:acetyl-CoA C-acetyltransferase
MREAVIVSGARTAIGAFGGALKDVAAIDLGALVIKQALKRVNLKPVPSAEMQAAAPDKLKGQGLIELEKKAADWAADAAPVTVD